MDLDGFFWENVDVFLMLKNELISKKLRWGPERRRSLNAWMQQRRDQRGDTQPPTASTKTSFLKPFQNLRSFLYECNLFVWSMKTKTDSKNKNVVIFWVPLRHCESTSHSGGCSILVDLAFRSMKCHSFFSRLKASQKRGRRWLVWLVQAYCRGCHMMCWVNGWSFPRCPKRSSTKRTRTWCLKPNGWWGWSCGSSWHGWSSALPLNRPLAFCSLASKKSRWKGDLGGRVKVLPVLSWFCWVGTGKIHGPTKKKSEGWLTCQPALGMTLVECEQKHWTFCHEALEGLILWKGTSPSCFAVTPSSRVKMGRGFVPIPWWWHFNPSSMALRPAFWKDTWKNTTSPKANIDLLPQQVMCSAQRGNMSFFVAKKTSCYSFEIWGFDGCLDWRVGWRMVENLNYENKGLGDWRS